MPRREFERMELELQQLEKELTDRLRAELNIVSQRRNTHVFFSIEYNPHKFPSHFLYKNTEELLKIGRDTIELRTALALPTDACVGRLLEQACIETANLDNPHGLGPIRIAQRLLKEIEAVSTSSTSPRLANRQPPAPNL
jgi:hypothetical protein